MKKFLSVLTAGSIALSLTAVTLAADAPSSKTLDCSQVTVSEKRSCLQKKKTLKVLEAIEIMKQKATKKKTHVDTKLQQAVDRLGNKVTRMNARMLRKEAHFNELKKSSSSSSMSSVMSSASSSMSSMSSMSSSSTSSTSSSSSSMSSSMSSSSSSHS